MSERRPEGVRIRRRAVGVAGLGLGAALALGLAVGPGAAGLAGADSAAAGPDEIADVLSGIDFVPDRHALDAVLGDAATSQLVAIARGRNASLDDAGVRVRAFRALAYYPSVGTEAELRAALDEHGGSEGGIDTLYVRAAMDSLARVAGDRAVSPIAPMLLHASRDVRAEAAHALGLTRSARAVTVLSERLDDEMVPQVATAIRDALQVLSEATTGTNAASQSLPNSGDLGNR